MLHVLFLKQTKIQEYNNSYTTVLVLRSASEYNPMLTCRTWQTLSHQVLSSAPLHQTQTLRSDRLWIQWSFNYTKIFLL